MTSRKKELGAKGEDFAVHYLKKRGYRIIERNYRVRFGEVDIVAEQDNTLVFIEVKTRTDTLFGTPFDSVTLKKQQQLTRVAQDYLSNHGCQERPARFDVVGIMLRDGGETFQDAEIELLQNAFEFC